MKYTMYTMPILGFALALAGAAGAAERPTDTAPASAETMPAKIDAEQARRELDQMREQMRELSRKMAEMSAKLGDVGPRAYAYGYLGDPERGLIGVVLSKDESGTRVTAVTPGGPAEKAGIRNGDLIVAVRAAAKGSTIDAPKLVGEALRNLKVGQDVMLTVLRDGRKTDLSVKAERREPYDANYAINGTYAFSAPDAQALRASVDEAMQAAKLDQQQIEALRRQSRDIAQQATEQARLAEQQARLATRHASLSTPWWGLNLASLNADLGGYFGADHGVLVLSADVDAAKTLKSGDVLLAIDGNKVERPEDALRLLRDRSAGGELKVEVLRQHKTLTLSMKAPEFKNMFVPAPPPPLPPLAPIAPIAPIPAIPPIAPPKPPSPNPEAHPAPVPDAPAPAAVTSAATAAGTALETTQAN